MYSIDIASREIGKRVIVSLRLVCPGQEDQYSGYWGVKHSVHDGGLLVEVEGGSDEQLEMLPPDLNILDKAKHNICQFNDETIIENIDYEVYLTGALDPANF
ncbi:hypothetical protein OQJ62_15930 [Microbulbifer thermotolerans]|uniref:hypothetical protein n=1 Tax=Microbulbifer thermotolerans TaxID=252514 RepID=UPI002249660D|nr:hypothetical protein [Microbulbifer thermotolerans]MCX2796414.1 hypothetical protein [Microbulbifer thermotolerans]